MDFVAIDFETANSNNNSACSMGIACVKDKRIINTEYYLIQPPTMTFNKRNIEIHGITPEDVKDEPKFPEIWEKIKILFENNLIIAHNAQFDMSVLKSMQLKYSLDIPNFEYLCSIPISTVVCDGVGNSMKDRARYLGIDMGNHHNALDDAVTCASIVIKTLERKKMNSLETLIRRYRLPIRDFSNLKHLSSFFKGDKTKVFQSVNISEILPDVEELDYTHPFYGKYVVFTGLLKELHRKDAMQIVVNQGGILKSGVSRSTNYLIVGEQDKNIVGEDGLSSKQRKAYELLSKGFDIKILNEEEFLELIEASHYT